MKYKVKHIDWHRAGIVTAALTAILSLIFIVIMSPFFVLGSALGSGSEFDNIGMGIGFGFVIFLPIIYSVVGYIFGALYAAIYNFIASKNLALEIELEESN